MLLLFLLLQTAKMEVMKDVEYNPIMQDESKGKPRYYTYGVPFFNYGLLPQTWEDPYLKVKIGLVLIPPKSRLVA